MITTTVGRDSQIDVITAGRPGARPVLPGSAAKFESLLAHFRRRYDTVVVSAPIGRLETARAVAGAVGQFILCARTGRTRIGVFGRTASMVRAAGAKMRGIVLWEADDPNLMLHASAAGGAEPAPAVSAAIPSASDLPNSGMVHPGS